MQAVLSLLWLALLLSLDMSAAKAAASVTATPHLSVGMHLVNVKETKTTAISHFQAVLKKTFQDMVATITIGENQVGLAIHCQVDPSFRAPLLAPCSSSHADHFFL
jgi:hypothetical protein